MSPSATSQTRALQDSGKATRRAATFYRPSSLKLRLDFNKSYSGNLHRYAMGWGSSTRRQKIAVDDGSASRAADLSSYFRQGAWVSARTVVARVVKAR